MGTWFSNPNISDETDAVMRYRGGFILNLEGQIMFVPVSDEANGAIQTIRMVVEDGMDVPSYAHEGDAGLDLRVKENVSLMPGHTVMVGTGVRAAIPKGYVGKVFMRSGFATKKNIVLANGTGIIDSGYRGEIMLPLFNMTKHLRFIKKGERVAQLVVERYATCNVEVVDELDDTNRGTGGFGSSGTD